MMNALNLVEDITNKIEYKSISNIDRFKKYANDILGGYGEMSDADIKEDIKEIYIDGELKGYIGFSKYADGYGSNALGIGNFMIIERGQGYGTQVIKDIVSKYKSEYDLIYCFVDSDNEGAVSLYKKLGKVYDEEPSDSYYVTFYDNGEYKLDESLSEDLAVDKVYKLDDMTRREVRRNPLYSNYKVEVVELEPLVTQLMKNTSILGRRTNNWGDSFDKYHIESNKAYWHNDPIRLVKSSDGEYKVLDGNHRLIALYNDGYKQVECLVKDNQTTEVKEGLTESSTIDIDWDGKGWILENGKIISTNNGPHHEKDHLIDPESNVVRYNFGYERYIGLPKNNLTSAQYDTLEKLLDLFFVSGNGVGERSRSIEIDCSIDSKGDFTSKIYKPSDYTSDDIIKKIKRYYSTGTLYESCYDNGKNKLEESYKGNRSLDNIETPEELMSWMKENITYELANDEYGAENDPPTKTAEEVIETGTGHCAEQSYLEYRVLDELGYFPQLIFVKENNSEDDYGADGSAHMFVVYQDDDEKYVYFEHSQEHNKGIHKFDSMSELLDFVGKNWWRYDANSDILEVRYIDEPITGVDNWELAQECHKYPVDEVLDISNNIMEDDVPLDAKWDSNQHRIIKESLSTEELYVSDNVKKFIEENINLMEKDTKDSWTKFFDKLRSEFGCLSKDYQATCDIVQIVSEDILNRLDKIPDAWLYEKHVDKLVIPRNIKKIGEDAFQDSVINNVYYEGTLDEYLNIDRSYNYLYSENTKLYINNKLVENITIDVPVVDNAFERYTGLKNVVFGKNVVELEWRAFLYCKNLETVKFLGDSVYIGDDVFRGCDKIQLVGDLPDPGDPLTSWLSKQQDHEPSAIQQLLKNSGTNVAGVRYFGPKQNKLKYMISVTDQTLKELNIVEGCEVILDNALTKSFDKLIFPKSLKTLCPQQNTVHKKIVVQSNFETKYDPNHRVWDVGILELTGSCYHFPRANIDTVYFNKSMSQFLNDPRIPSSKHLYVDGKLVTDIRLHISKNEQMFYPGFINQDITSIYVTSDIIHPISAHDMPNLTNYIFDKNVTLYHRCIENCPKLTRLTFLGTKKEWRSIKKDSKWRSYSNLQEVVCTDGIIEL